MEGKRICVVGGGAAGMMAAGTAARCGADVTLFEQNRFLGKKLAITGKGRCNVTNNCKTSEFLDNVIVNPRFLYSALTNFDTESTMKLFEELGVPLKTERGNRVFPVSEKAIDIVNAMRKYSSAARIINEKVKSIKKCENGSFSVLTDKSEYYFDKVILATGGKSYPRTGSDGSGYRLACKLGHTVTELIPSLIPIESDSLLCSRMQGLSLKNVGIEIRDAENRCIYEDFGEMMFTHFGVTGPIILSASTHLRNQKISTLKLHIDLKPALDEKKLNERILSDFNAQSNRDYANSLSRLLPSKMIEPFVDITKIPPHKKVNLITKDERKKIVSTMKDFQIPLKAFRPIEEAIVTSGGVSVKEIMPKSMESKLACGLYFAGEILDVDAYTGGFNLQIAFSTGYLAGKSAAEN